MGTREFIVETDYPDLTASSKISLAQAVSVVNNRKNKNIEGFKVALDKDEAPQHSLLLDENGEPKVFYHQTANEFDTSDIRHRGAGSTDKETPFGVFLKPTADDIGVSGNIQMPLFVRIHNPIKFNNRYELKKHLVNNVPGYAEGFRGG